MTNTLHQSSWQRAAGDTWLAQTTSPRLWLGQATFSLMGIVFLPHVLSDGTIAQTVVSVIGGAGGPLIVFFAVGLWNLFRAPYRQRDEAWRQLESKPKPLPLPNRQQLLEAIADAQSAAVHYGARRRRLLKANAAMLSSCEVEDLLDARRNAFNALQSLQKQTLVAGIDYEPTLGRLYAVIWVEVAHLSTVKELPDPWTFNNNLDNAVRQAVQDIEGTNRLAIASGQAEATLDAC